MNIEENLFSGLSTPLKDVRPAEGVMFELIEVQGCPYQPDQGNPS